MISRCLFSFVIVSALVFSTGCRLFGGGVPPPVSGGGLAEPLGPSAGEAARLLEEFGGDEEVFQLAHYLYRWQLDENDFDPEHRNREFERELWLRRLTVPTDPQDRSQFLEVAFPSIGICVVMKKADYRIDELGLDLKGGGYRVVRVSREHFGAAEARRFLRYGLDTRKLYDRLFQERHHAVFPDERLVARMKAAVLRESAGLLRSSDGQQERTVYVAPVHTIANEVWIYWEEEKLLFHFASDQDLHGNPEGLDDTLGVAIYDAVDQTIVSYEEKPGDNRYLTRDQVGRALYNCIVLGKKSKIPAN